MAKKTKGYMLKQTEGCLSPGHAIPDYYHAAEYLHGFSGGILIMTGKRVVTGKQSICGHKSMKRAVSSKEALPI